MKKENMDLWMKTSLEDYSSPIPLGGWKGLHQSRRKKKSRFLFWLSAACLLVFAGLGLWNFSSHLKPELVQEIHEQPNFRSSLKNNGTVAEIPSHVPAEAKTPQLTQIETQTGTRISKLEKEAEPAASLSEWQQVPETLTPTPVALFIKSQPLSPISISLPTAMAHPIQEEIQPRFGRKLSFFLESGMAFGTLSLAEDASPAMYRSTYSSFLKEQKLRHVERSLGIMAYYQGLRRWSMGTGMSVSHTTASGNVDYAYYESGMNLASFGTQSWSDKTLTQSKSFSHETTFRSWNISVPLRFRYQAFAHWGPYFEIGAAYTYNLSNQGDWLDPESVTLQQNLSLVPKHRLSTQVAIGYQWRLRNTSLSLNYCFNPWSTKYAPVHGRMGTQLHGFSIQIEMPH